MLRKIVALVMGLAVLFASTFVFAEDVYVTKRGKKYHKQDCRLISKSDVQKISVEEAEAKGLKPCKRCFAPTKKQTKQKIGKVNTVNEEGLVYATARGKKYHRADCRLIKNKNVTGLSLADAKGKGLKPCSRCFLQEAKAE